MKRDIFVENCTAERKNKQALSSLLVFVLRASHERKEALISAFSETAKNG